MSVFDDITPTQAEVNSVKSSKHWEADVQPDEPTGPITGEERAALDRMGERSTDPFASATIVEEGYKGEWIPPKVRDAQRRALLLPKVGLIKREEDRLFEVARFDGQPDELAKAVAAARRACQKAYAVLDEARHPEIPTRPKSAEHKQAALDAIEAAKVAVSEAVRISERDAIRAEQYENIVGGIAEAQAKAASALETAAEAFARWRGLINEGDELAKATGRFGLWHEHKDERSINPRGLVGDLRRARDLARTEDPYLSGRYLYDDPTPEGDLPEWTREKMAAGSEWDTTVLWRLRARRPEDPAARDTLVARDLRIINLAPVPVLHPEAQKWGEGFGPVHDNDWD